MQSVTTESLNFYIKCNQLQRKVQNITENRKHDIRVEQIITARLIRMFESR